MLISKSQVGHSRSGFSLFRVGREIPGSCHIRYCPIRYRPGLSSWAGDDRQIPGVVRFGFVRFVLSVNRGFVVWTGPEARGRIHWQLEGKVFGVDF